MRSAREYAEEWATENPNCYNRMGAMERTGFLTAICKAQAEAYEAGQQNFKDRLLEEYNQLNGGWSSDDHLECISVLTKLPIKQYAEQSAKPYGEQP